MTPRNPTSLAPLLVIVIMLGSLLGGTMARAETSRPQIVAHRGASHLAPENTAAAVALAWELGADAVEVDIRLTRDGEIVLLHDSTTRRTAGVDRPVRDQTWAEVAKRDAGSWKADRYAGEPIPLLRDILAIVPDDRRLLIEIKTGPEIIDPLIAVLDASGVTPSQVRVIGFDRDVVRAFKERRPDVSTYWLSSLKKDDQTGQWQPTIEQIIAQALEAGVDGVDLRAVGPVRDPDAVEQIRQAGLELHVWTVDDPDVAYRLWQLGVDSITTNRVGEIHAQLLDRVWADQHQQR